MADKIVETAEEFRKESAKHDMTVKFDGRTLVVTCMFYTVVNPQLLSERVRQAAGGPLLRMAFGGLQRTDSGYRAKSYVNTDEDEKVVIARMKAMDPKPAQVNVSVCNTTEARQLWAALHRMADGGD